MAAMRCVLCMVRNAAICVLCDPSRCFILKHLLVCFPRAGGCIVSTQLPGDLVMCFVACMVLPLLLLLLMLWFWFVCMIRVVFVVTLVGLVVVGSCWRRWSLCSVLWSFGGFRSGVVAVCQFLLILVDGFLVRAIAFVSVVFCYVSCSSCWHLVVVLFGCCLFFVCLYVYVYVCVCLCECIYMCMYVCMYVNVCMCMYVYMCMCK